MTTTSSDSAGATERAQPESFRGRDLAVSLTVNDLARSLEWYADVLRFTVDRKHERDGVLRAVSLKAGSVRLLLAQDDGAKGANRVKGEGFSFQITTAQNVDEIASGIKERGGTFLSEPADMFGARMFRLKDPDGFVLVISSERS